MAEFFGKQHKNVLADIKNILSTAEISAMDYFNPAQAQPHPTVRGRMLLSWDMTKDGFTLLVMASEHL
ncbi:Rha family transcriptional regulator [Terasakiella pusilla]|uniref:Rha family transcriptional regulator n=1 Tax=Terasakiella pusilla TaxID=64973 RepID=UPI003AA9C0EE